MRVSPVLSVLALFVVSSFSVDVLPQPTLPSEVTRAIRLLERMQAHDKSRPREASSLIEEFLERNPGHPEALTYYAAATLYSGNLAAAEVMFKKAIDLGGGASLLVRHSHSTNKPFIGTDALTDFCSGWMHIRASGVGYVSDYQGHSFQLQFPQIKKFEKNKLSKGLFHLEFEKKNYNFYGRTNTDEEILLVKVLFDRVKGRAASSK